METVSDSDFDKDLKRIYARCELRKLAARMQYQKAEMEILESFKKEVEEFSLHKLGYVPPPFTPAEYRRLASKSGSGS